MCYFVQTQFISVSCTKWLLDGYFWLGTHFEKYSLYWKPSFPWMFVQLNSLYVHLCRFGTTWYMVFWSSSLLSWVSINLLLCKIVYLFSVLTFHGWFHQKHLQTAIFNCSLECSIKGQGWGLRKRTTSTVDVFEIARNRLQNFMTGLLKHRTVAGCWRRERWSII